MNATDNNLKALLLGFADIINEQRSELPTGCVSKSNNGGFNANSIGDVNNLNNDVDAPDGFIRNGLLVKCAGQKKAGLLDKWHGYKVMFELNGIYNGLYTVFTKTELEYKLYLNKDMWKIEAHEIEYKPIAEGGESFKRIYKVPMTLDMNTAEFRCADRRNTLDNKVGLAMKSKLGADYEAYLEDKVFNDVSGKFELVSETV